MSRLALALEQAQPVTLDGLNASATLLTRRDRKYIVPVDDAARLVEALSPDARALTIDGLRTFRYESVYFDTPDFRSFLGAARRRSRRFKIRTRSYLDTGRCVLEIKTRDPRGRTVKARHDYSLDLEEELDEIGLQFVSSCPLVGEDGARLRPVLRTRYERSTLVLTERVRVTIDLRLEACTPDGLDLRLMGMAVVETKSPGRPSIADRQLWAMGHRPLRISKFGTSLSALHPELPSNKWTRALSGPWIISGRPPRRDSGRQASTFEDRAGTGDHQAADSASNGRLLDGHGWVASISDSDRALGGASRPGAGFLRTLSDVMARTNGGGRPRPSLSGAERSTPRDIEGYR